MASEIKGGKELARILNLLPKEIGAKVLSSALMTGAGVIQREIQERAPVRKDANAKAFGTGRRSARSKGRLGGFLRKSITRRRLRGNTNKQARVAITLGNAFYGKFLEFGTSTITKKPFIRPAFDDSGPLAVKKITGDLGKKIEKAAVKLAGKFKTSGLASRRRR